MTTYATEIIYCTETHDYAMYLGGELVGFARTYDDADKTLAELTADLTSGALLQPPYAALLDDQSADHQPLHIGTGHYIRLEIDPCEVCDEPATVTVRISREPTPLRLCRDCYSTMWDNNEEITVSWEADFDPEPQPPYTALLDAAGSPEPDPPPPVPPGQGGDDPERGPYSDEYLAEVDHLCRCADGEFILDWAGVDALAAHVRRALRDLAAPLTASPPQFSPDAPAGGDAANAAGLAKRATPAKRSAYLERAELARKALAERESGVTVAIRHQGRIVAYHPSAYVAWRAGEALREVA